VYGVSVGAVNAAAYCGDPTTAGVAELGRVWRGLSAGAIFPKRRVHGPWSYFGHRSAVHANSGLRRVLTDGLRFQRLEDAPVPFEVVATSLTDGLEHWLTEGPAIEAVLASSAIPAIFPPVRIGNELYMDGGVVDNVPVGRAIAAGAKHIYVLLCGPVHYRPAPARRPVEAVFTAFFVAVHARFARELSSLPEGVECHVFSGGGDLNADYRDFSQTAGLIAAGRAEVASVLDADSRAPAPGVPLDGAAGGQSQPAGAQSQPYGGVSDL
ncbi:MAG: patatin-like phospholipase family protein, partial [Acidimicrobiales bacterium]